MAGGERTVKVKFTGDQTGLDRSANKSADSMEQWSRRLNRASAVAAGGFVAVGVGLERIGAQFDDAFDTIQVKTGAMGQQLDALDQSFNKALAGSVGSAQDTAEALAGLAVRTKLTGPPLEDLTRQLVDLNHLTGIDIPTAVDVITRVFGDWSIATANQSRALDELFRASQVSGTGVEAIASQVVEFGAPLRQLGFNFEDAITIIGKWNAEGVNTELVLGALKKALGAFSKAGKDPVAALAALESQIKSAGSTAKANQIAISTLGVKAGPDFAAAVREGRFDFQKMLDTVKNGQSTITGTTDATADWSESLQKLKNDALLAVGPTASSWFGTLDSVGVPALRGLFEWTQKNQGVTNVLLTTLGLLGGALLIANAGMRIYQGAVVLTTVATKAWAAIQLILDLELWASPIGIIILAIIALVAGITLITIGVSKLGINWGAVWDGMLLVAKGVWNWLTVTAPLAIYHTFKTIGEYIRAPFIAAFNYVARAWNNSIGRLSWTVPAWVPGLAGDTISVPKIPYAHLASGGVARAGGAYMVNERGGEPFFPAENGRVISHEDAMAALRGSGGGDTYVVVRIGNDDITHIVRAERVDADSHTRRWVLAGSAA